MTGILNLLAGAFGSVKDAYFNLTSLLLSGNGTNGAQNNTFLDSSTNNFTITRNGNTTQGSFTPFSQAPGYWSNYFDGGANYLSASSSASPSGTEDFCIEFWYCPGVKPSNYPAIFTENTTYSFTTSLQIFDRHDAFSTKFSVYGCGINGMASTTTVTQGTWYHIAVTRNLNGGVYTLRLFVNGALEASQTGASGSLSANACYIGRGDTASLSLTYINAYVSNFRIVRGSSVYTSAFTPSTSPLTAITNTSLLTCQSNRFVDNSANAFAITVNGTPSVQAFSPFAPTAAYSAATNGGSGYFDGTGDYLSAASNAAFAFGTGDFSVEFWFYPTVSSQDNYDKYFSTGNAVGNFYIDQQTIANQITINDGSTVFVSSSSNLTPFAWNHVVVSRVSTTLRIFLNGAQVGSVTNSTNFTQTGAFVAANGAGASNVTGYFSGFRVVKGSGVSSVTVPTTPPTAITNTQLLLNYTNAGIVDSTGKNVLETGGNAQISTTQSKFGGSSLYFDGTGDYLIPNMGTSDLFAFGTGDFTVEMWVYHAGGTAVLYDSRPVATNGNYLQIFISSGQLGLYVNSSTILQAGTISTNTWTHLAVSRSGTSLRAFINGTQVGSTVTNSTSFLNAAQRPIIGANGNTLSADNYNGYIDDLRVTKGFARYTANFSVPTAAFALQ